MRSPLAGSILLLVPISAAATFHLWDITEVYSNASGTVQYVELFDGFNNEDELAGHTIKSNTITYTFPTDLDPDPMGNGNNATANRHFLIATPGFASLPGAVTPDFTFAAANFMSTVADTINFSNVDTFVFGSGELPTDGINSLNEPYNSNVRTTAQNSPTNFAGQVGSLPEPSGWLGMLAGAFLVFGLARMAGCAVGFASGFPALRATRR
jgi:hypothetical protein